MKSRGLTRVIPLTVPNPPEKDPHAGVVSAFFSLRYRLDKLSRQSVSQSVSQSIGFSVGWLLAHMFARSIGFLRHAIVRRGTSHLPVHTRALRSMPAIDQASMHLHSCDV